MFPRKMPDSAKLRDLFNQQLQQAIAAEQLTVLTKVPGIGRKGAERIELVEIGAGESRAYYRRDGVHYVPKLRLDDLLIG